jgi:hypothetical protein
MIFVLRRVHIIQTLPVDEVLQREKENPVVVGVVHKHGPDTDQQRSQGVDGENKPKIAEDWLFKESQHEIGWPSN